MGLVKHRPALVPSLHETLPTSGSSCGKRAIRDSPTSAGSINSTLHPAVETSSSLTLQVNPPTGFTAICDTNGTRPQRRRSIPSGADGSADAGAALLRVVLEGVRGWLSMGSFVAAHARARAAIAANLRCSS